MTSENLNNVIYFQKNKKQKFKSVTMKEEEKMLHPINLNNLMLRSTPVKD